MVILCFTLICSWLDFTVDHIRNSCWGTGLRACFILNREYFELTTEVLCLLYVESLSTLGNWHIGLYLGLLVYILYLGLLVLLPPRQSLLFFFLAAFETIQFSNGLFLLYYRSAFRFSTFARWHVLSYHGFSPETLIIFSISLNIPSHVTHLYAFTSSLILRLLLIPHKSYMNHLGFLLLLSRYPHCNLWT